VVRPLCLRATPRSNGRPALTRTSGKAPLERLQGALPFRPSAIHSREGGKSRTRAPEDADFRRGATVVPSRHAAFEWKTSLDKNQWESAVGAPAGSASFPPERDSLARGRK